MYRSLILGPEPLKLRSRDRKSSHTQERVDALAHTLTRIFLPGRCETTTCRERYDDFVRSIEGCEWSNAKTWVKSIENNRHELSYLYSTFHHRAPDAIVAIRMERWIARVFGGKLEDLMFVDKDRTRTQHSRTQTIPLWEQVPAIHPTLMDEMRTKTQPVQTSSHPRHNLMRPPGPVRWAAWGPHQSSNQPLQHTSHAPRQFPASRSLNTTYPSLYSQQAQQAPISYNRPHFRNQSIARPPTNDNSGEGTNTTLRATLGHESQGPFLRKAKSAVFSGSIGTSDPEAPQRSHPVAPPSRVVIPNPSGRTTPPHKRGVAQERKQTYSEVSQKKVPNKIDSSGSSVKGEGKDGSLTPKGSDLSDRRQPNLRPIKSEGSLPHKPPAPGIGRGKPREPPNRRNEVPLTVGPKIDKTPPPITWSSVVKGSPLSKPAKESQITPSKPPKPTGITQYTKSAQSKPQTPSKPHEQIKTAKEAQVNLLVETDPAESQSAKKTQKELHPPTRAGENIEPIREQRGKPLGSPWFTNVPQVVPNSAEIALTSPTPAEVFRSTKETQAKTYSPPCAVSSSQSPEKQAKLPKTPTSRQADLSDVVKHIQVVPATPPAPPRTPQPASLPSEPSTPLRQAIKPQKTGDEAPRRTVDTQLSALAPPFEPISRLRGPTLNNSEQEGISALWPTGLTDSKPTLPSRDPKVLTLTESFYRTPQFSAYLNKSYRYLLLQENLLRIQYFKIKGVFEDEWAHISPIHREAVATRALSNLAEMRDTVQFGEDRIEDMLWRLGLKGQGRGVNLQEQLLRWRAEYCFEMDPKAIGSSPFWLFSIIGWIIGGEPPLQEAFIPAPFEAVPGDQKGDVPGNPIQCNSGCPKDCPNCGSEVDSDGSSTGTVTQREQNDKHKSEPLSERPLGHTRGVPRSISTQSLPTLPLEELKTSEDLFAESFPPLPSRPISEGLLPPLEDVRLMSNEMLDPIFHHGSRPEEWHTAHRGASQFMKLVQIDKALFYCQFIEEILLIVDSIRRERVWYRLPTITDWNDGGSAPMDNTDHERGRHFGGSSSSLRYRSPSPEGGINTEDQSGEEAFRTAEIEKVVAAERERVLAFVRETQRTADHFVLGITLVYDKTGEPVEDAHDGGLWGIPLKHEEERPVYEQNEKLRIFQEG
ncbi:hypothetical protein L873DRAFT_1792733 [Choiromyces venosus 120613-1]|uniref:Uncharacterized protein n=1 Tax=Choiromyces venosus 120613-1 TaxID=1336337 RepID=A0A3N4JCX1_9PEZI|nr:hypothetical protein L873DRAFT_1792733 [Choiromyces venosus 120613-1]